jgi:cellulose synthase/poly-beta-1,6-N-acetylglucosamine synthase-like glycosyltransferase
MKSRVPAGAAVARSASSFSVSEPAARSSNDRSDEQPAIGAADCSPEIECVRSQISAGIIEAAEQRASALGVGADRVLIAAGEISEEAYLRAFSVVLNVPFEPLDGVPRSLFPINDERLIEWAAAGMMPLRVEGELSLVVAPRGLAARRIARIIKVNPALARRFRFTSAERLADFALRHCGKLIADRAADELKKLWPLFSAARSITCASIFSIFVIALSALTAGVMAPSSAIFALEVIFAGVFLTSIAFRITGALVGWYVSTPSPGSRDDAVPVYTVIAALYDEAASVEGLLTAIRRLDYPLEKLDVILAVEANDRDTRAAVAKIKGRVPFTVIPVPAGALRTKPRALNAALAFARGTFTVVYDAEDRPEPDQLRLALQAFSRGDRDLACVQARLCIDNTADSWLTRLFTAEYAGLFDVFLPGLAAMRLPLPLGGSSNHFRTSILRKVHGWDPYNVTEDADLGIRLARFGYRSETIASTTHEEAPAKTRAWLHQRTRWFKGWMQTWLVHMRKPYKLVHDLGLFGCLTFQLIVGGNILAGLVHPIFMALFIFSMATGMPWWLKIFYFTTIAIGYFASAFLGWLGLMRRDMSTSPWALLLTPIYWMLLSIAAWRALYQLVRAPYHWKKTKHGLAKTSQRAIKLTRSLLALERHLSALKASGDLPTIPKEVRDIVADRRPRGRINSINTNNHGPRATMTAQQI